MDDAAVTFYQQSQVVIADLGHVNGLEARPEQSQAPKARQEELASHSLQLPAWYRRASPGARLALAAAHTQYREAQNSLEDTLGRIDDVLDFAEPLLKAAIQKRFNLTLDVRQVYFARKYAPKKGRDDFGGFLVFEQSTDSQLNYRYRAVTLLEAALANFDPDEEQRSSCSDCQVITRFSAFDRELIPGFEDLEAQALPILPHEFAQLCRSLDLGARYQEHLKSVLEPQDQARRKALEDQWQAHRRQQFVLSMEVASLQLQLHPGGGSRIKHGISADARKMLEQLLIDPHKATLDGRPVTFAAPTIFGSVLVGPLLIGPDRPGSRRTERLVVYIPNDPQQPLKEYPSGDEFMADLRVRLHSLAYRRFFSQFVPLQEQGRFFQQFNTLYQPEGSTEATTDFALKASPATLVIGEFAITGNLWRELHQAHISKLLADARAVAVTTDDEDREARIRRLEGFLDAVINVFNMAAFVVPGLGPIMLAVGAAQMMSDVFSGIEAYEQDEIREMWRCFSSVALNTAFIATGATVLPQIQWSGHVEGLKRVTLPNGQHALWRPRLDGYELPDSRLRLRPMSEACLGITGNSRCIWRAGTIASSSSPVAIITASSIRHSPMLTSRRYAATAKRPGCMRPISPASGRGQC